MPAWYSTQQEKMDRWSSNGDLRWGGHCCEVAVVVLFEMLVNPTKENYSNNILVLMYNDPIDDPSQYYDPHQQGHYQQV